jgi:hypothetical protein
MVVVIGCVSRQNVLVAAKVIQKIRIVHEEAESTHDKGHRIARGVHEGSAYSPRDKGLSALGLRQAHFRVAPEPTLSFARKKYARDERGKKATIAPTCMILINITPNILPIDQKSTRIQGPGYVALLLQGPVEDCGRVDTMGINLVAWKTQQLQPGRNTRENVARRTPSATMLMNCMNREMYVWGLEAPLTLKG